MCVCVCVCVCVYVCVCTHHHLSCNMTEREVADHVILLETEGGRGRLDTFRVDAKSSQRSLFVSLYQLLGTRHWSSTSVSS